MLKAWKTPFQNESFPSVWVTSEKGGLDNTLVFVGWPAKWKIQFERIVGLKVNDETYDSNKRFWIDRDVNDLCSYTWENSPWLQDFNADFVEALEDGKVIHYVFLGGDHNVEILACGKVTIDHVEIAT